MKRKLTSRITALVLALSMLASIAPAMPVQTAAAAEEPISVAVNFVLDTGALSQTTLINKPNNKNYRSIPSVNDLPAEVWDGWTLNTELTSTTYMSYLNSTANTYQWNSLTYSGIQLNLNRPANEAVAFDFDAPADGYYDLSEMDFTSQSGGKINVSVKNGNGATTNLGTLFTAAATREEQKNVGIVYLTKGVNTLLLSCAENADGNNRTFFYSFIFDKRAATVKVDLSASDLLAGETATVNAYVEMADGTVYDQTNLADGDSIALSSSNEAVASLENGVVTALANGTARINAVANIGENEYTGYADVKVIELKDAKVTIDFRLSSTNNTRIQAVDTKALGGWTVNETMTSPTIMNRITTTDYAFKSAYTGMQASMLTSRGDFALNFETQRAGYYDVSAAFSGYADGTYNEAGAMDISVKAAGKDRVRVATVDATKLDATNAAFQAAEIITYGVVYLSRGENQIIFTGTVDGTNYNGTGPSNFMRFESVTFTPRRTEVNIDMDVSALSKGETAAINAWVDMADGAVYTQDSLNAGDSIVISSSNPQVASVENGVVTALANGTAEISAVATIGGEKYTGTALVKVIDLTAADFKLTADKPFPIKTGRKADVLVQGAYSNIIIDMEKAENVNIKSSDDNIATATYSYKNGGMNVRVTGVSAGTADITVSAEYQGISAETVISVEVEDEAKTPETYTLNFAQAAFEELTLEEHGLAVNPQTKQEILDRYSTTVYAGSSMKGELKKGEALYLDFTVPESGDFALDFTGLVVAQAGFTAAFYIDDEFVGEFFFSDANGSTDETGYSMRKHFRDVHLDADEVHTMKIERVDTYGSFMWLMNMVFKPIAAPAAIAGISTTCTQNTILPGDSANAEFGIRMSDGTDYLFPSFEQDNKAITIENLTPARATYSGSVLTAKKSGLAMIEIAADIAAGDISALWSIRVADGQLFDFKSEKDGVDPASATPAKNNWAVSTETSVDKANAAYALNTQGFSATFENGQELVLDINVEKDGVYNVDAVGTILGSTGCAADFWIGEEYLGRFDFGDEASAEAVRAPFNTVELNAGANTLYIKRVSAEGGSNILLDRVVLTEVDEMPAVSHVTITAESSEIELYKTLQAEAKVWMTDGREYHIGTKRDGSVDAKNKIEYSYTPDGIFTVDDSLLMTGVKPGAAELTVNATVKGAAVEPVKREFTVVRVLRLSASDKLRMERGDTASVELTATLDEEPVDLTAAEFNVIPNQSATGEVRFEDGKAMLYVTGLRIGDAAITVEATLEGVTGSISVPIMAFLPINREDKMKLEFRNTQEGVPSTPDEANFVLHGWQVNRELSSTNTLTNTSYVIQSTGLKTAIKKDELFAIDFIVKESGNYAIDFIGGQIGTSGAKGLIYFDDIYMGEFDFTNPTATGNSEEYSTAKTALNSIPLSAGEHTITIKCIRDAKYAFIYWEGVDFTLLDEDITFDHVKAEIGSETLSVGESTGIIAQAIMSDGSVRNMGERIDGSADENNSLTVTSSNSAVAEVKDGRVYARSQGDATITVTAKVDGVMHPAKEIPVTVDGGVLTDIEVTLNDEMYIGKTATLGVKAYVGDRAVDMTSVEITSKSDDATVVSTSGTSVTGESAGTATVTVSARLGEEGERVSKDIEITVSEDGMTGFTVSALSRRMRPTSEGTQIKVEGASFQGNPIDLSAAEITYDIDDEDVITVSETGWVTPVVLGEEVVRVTVKAGEFEGTKEITIVVTNGKVGRSYYTEEKVANAMENIAKYSWATSEKNSVVKSADKYVDMVDELWNIITTQNLPRSIRVGYRNDPQSAMCRYCGVDLVAEHGKGDVYTAWGIDPVNAPWKVQCKACRRMFPTNDFESFYKLGMVKTEEDAEKYGIPTGQWSYEKAHVEHGKQFGYDYYEYIASGERLPAVGYLKNDRYPEVAEVATLNGGDGLDIAGGETVEGWGVDDGFGYKTGKTYPSGVTFNGVQYGDFDESHTYIAHYNSMTWYREETNILRTLAKAYLYTGQAKYGRVGAIMVDRMADAYPQMQHEEFFPFFPQSDSSSPYGKVVGCISEYSIAATIAEAYDAFYPMYDDPYVVNYLAEKSGEYSMENPKDNGDLIRQNIEDGILRTAFQGIKDGDIYGNFGMHQQALAQIAVVLDTEGETKEMLDYLMAEDEKGWRQSGHTGAEVLDGLINDIDRDGGAFEVAPHYSITLWHNTLGSVANILNGYEGYPAADLYKNPRFIKMFENEIDMTQVRRTSAAFGDSGATAYDKLLHSSISTILVPAFRASGSVKLAQAIYFFNKNTTEGLKADIYSKNPEQVAQEIQAVIDEHGEYPFDESLMNAGQGYAILRGGSLYAQGGLNEKDNQRDFWMVFAPKGNHGHADQLNLGMHVYGLDFAPDLGYPTSTSSIDYIDWGIGTISHNTVIVNDAPQAKKMTLGNPLHFDDAGRVKVMDVNANGAYAETDTYRRTVVMVEANDDVSYGIDVFRVTGGTEHLYSFHALSNEIGAWGGINPEEQSGGSYAGKDIPYGTTGITSGYSWLTDVRRAEKPETGEFFVEFNIEDFRNALKDNKDLKLRLTMLNDFELSEVAFAKGAPPKKNDNPEWLEWVLARRSSESGEELDTTFTTVLEPYKGERYITSAEQVGVVRADGADINSNGDVVRAVKVELVGDRTDYVIYATNNQAEYIVDGKISFKGFVGVVSYGGDEVSYSYLNDGTKIEDVASEQGISMASEYTGEVVDFTRTVEFENTITVKFDGGVSIEELEEKVVGRRIYVENDGAENAVYKIESIEAGEAEGTVDISIGSVTLIRSAENVTASSGDYVYNIAPKQWFSIPMSGTMSTAPVFASGSSDANLASGKRFTKNVTATSPAGRTISYTATALPRGASFNEETGAINWTPDNNQVGVHHVAIMADDGVLQTTQHLTLTVYKSAGSVTGTPSTDTGSNTPSTGTDTGSGSGSGAGSGASGGGASGGGGSSSGGDTSTDTDSTDDTSGDTSAGDDTTNIPSERFIDLGNHIWAKDAIYSLVDAGVVNGTSENTYSPANNIKRADFAIMLVRAFGITEGEGESFADVDANKYYAEELRLAKAAGIVNGIGENKFNPEGEITRQDMMLMLARALDAVGYELSDADQSVLAQFTDAASISDYAKDAVSRVVRDGIIAGANGRINPLAKATRAEVAVMLERVLSAE